MKMVWISIFFVMISGTSLADDFFNPPPLNPELPPWMQNQDQAQPNQQAPQQAPPDASAPSAEVPSFDTGSDEEDGGSPFDFETGSEGGGGGGGGRDSGKPNFQVVGPLSPSQQIQQDCVGWGNSFLGTKIFSSESACKSELEQDIENARDSINNYVDSTEKEVLRGVIKGKIDREKSKDFALDFTNLKNSLVLAAKSGCSCLE